MAERDQSSSGKMVTRGRGGWLDLPRGGLSLLFFASFLAHSQLGQTRHFAGAPLTSGLLQLADILWGSRRCIHVPVDERPQHQSRTTRSRHIMRLDVAF
jgi:hypothetical protein